MIRKLLLLIFYIFFFGKADAQNSFKVMPLGVLGGSDESNLSSYMVAPIRQSVYVCLDAGTLNAGIQKAIKNKVFKVNTEQILRDSIKGYLISHAHLDHLAGLILNSPDDSSKPIYAMPYVIDVFKKHYFSWDTWSNFANEGEKPTIGKYHYVALKPLEEQKIEETEMYVMAFSLSHAAPYQSTAFLIRSQQNYLLYLGDTGADSIEKSQKLDNLWRTIAPLIRAKTLKGIFIETSFPNSRSEQSLFGHLTPRLLMQEMENLSRYTGKEALKNFNLIVTHIKPGNNHIQEIKNEIAAANILDFKISYPKQGKPLIF